MPTTVNPDDPTATGAARLQSMVGGPRTPGSPSMAGKPGVQAGRTSFPAPPTPMSAPPGRQPDGARAAMGGAPTTPGTPAAGAAPTSAVPQQATAPSSQPGSSQPTSAAGSSKGGPAAPAPPPTTDATGALVTQASMSPTVPKPGTIIPGSTVQTPLGTVSASPTGQKLALDANGQMKYKESMAKLRGRFSLPRVMKGMQGLPEMELRLGASNYDPFSGRFHGKE